MHFSYHIADFFIFVNKIICFQLLISSVVFIRITICFLSWHLILMNARCLEQISFERYFSVHLGGPNYFYDVACVVLISKYFTVTLASKMICSQPLQQCTI